MSVIRHALSVFYPFALPENERHLRRVTSESGDDVSPSLVCISPATIIGWVGNRLPAFCHGHARGDEIAVLRVQKVRPAAR